MILSSSTPLPYWLQVMPQFWQHSWTVHSWSSEPEAQTEPSHSLACSSSGALEAMSLGQSSTTRTRKFRRMTPTTATHTDTTGMCRPDKPAYGLLRVFEGT